MAIAVRSWKALGTSVHVLATDAGELATATTAVSEVLEDVDAAYSRFRDDSELRRLNASPGRCVRVSPLLATAIDAAQRAARLTDGAVDPTIGHAIRVAGYDDDFSRVAARDPQPALPQKGSENDLKLRAWRVPGWQAIRFDRRSRTVLLPAGVELDLRSTGKARAADLAARAALAWTAAMVRGEAAIDWLLGRRLPARLVENDGTIHYIGRWPDPSGAAA